MFRALRPVLLLFLVAIPAVALRLTGTHPSALPSIFIFGLACFGVIMISGIARGWRRAAALERSGGVDEPSPRDGGTRPSAAPSLRRRSWPGRTPTGGERSAAADERLAG